MDQCVGANEVTRATNANGELTSLQWAVDFDIVVTKAGLLRRKARESRVDSNFNVSQFSSDLPV